MPGGWVVMRFGWKPGTVRILVIAVLFCLLQAFLMSSLDLSPPESSLQLLIKNRSGHYRYPSTRNLKDSPRVATYSHLNPFFPNESNKYDDRILAQLFIEVETSSMKTIAVHMFDKPLPEDEQFRRDECPVSNCRLVPLRADIDTSLDADAVVLGRLPLGMKLSPQQPHQVYITYQLESPLGAPKIARHANWTATYRPDSVLVAPYAKFVSHDEPLPDFVRNSHRQSSEDEPDVDIEKNFAEGKHKKVAWFVSNCSPKNDRMQYAVDLQKHIEVDIYGKCGPLICERKDNTCLEMLRTDYKFYLAFENANCHHYITEKFFHNALMRNILPIVMGARKEDYLAMAPPNSFIHVDDYESPSQLAEYLHYLDQNDTAYNAYFQWKNKGTFIDTKFWCRLCAMLHLPDLPMYYYSDVITWWKSTGVCTAGRWHQQRNSRNTWLQ